MNVNKAIANSDVAIGLDKKEAWFAIIIMALVGVGLFLWGRRSESNG